MGDLDRSPWVTLTSTFPSRHQLDILLLLLQVEEIAATMSSNNGLTAPGSSTYSSDTLHVGDGTWDSSRDTFLLPNLMGLNFATMQYNGEFLLYGEHILGDNKIGKPLLN